MELFKLLGTIAVENGDANKAIDDTTDKAEGAKGKFGQVFSKIGQGAVAVGKTIGVGLAAGATAMTGLAVKALNLGGELEQNLGGSEAVFKDFAGKMQDIGKTAFKDMGLSTSDFLATANKMGALFQGAGFGIEESADISSKAMQRAADVASIMGIDSASAMEAVAGAAKGNFTMMDNLGVAMNDTAIQNYALTKGINKTTAEMTQQEKIGLAMEMFMDKTSYAAGNYAKENETLAGSLGTAKAAFTNFLDGSGSVDDLVESLSGAADVILKNVDELLPRLVTGISELIKKLIPKIPPILNALLPSIVNGAVMLLEGLVDALPAIIDVLMGALPSLISGVQKILEAIINALPKIIQSLVNALPALIPQLITGLISVLVLLMQRLPEMLNPIIEKLPEIIISIINALMENLPALINGLIQLVIGIVQAMPQIILALIEALPTVITSIVTGLWNALPVLIMGIIQIVGEIGKAIWQVLSGFVTKLGEFFSGLWEGIKNIFSPVINFFTNVFSGAWTGIKNIFSGIGNFFGGIWDGIKNIFSGVGNWFKNIFSGAVDGIKNVFAPIGDFFGKVFGKLGDIIKAPINFVIKGLNFLIDGLNKISFDIPDWIPAIGGKKFGFNIGKIAMLANGGVVDKATPSIIGEDGAEAVVPLERNTGWINNLAKQIHTFTIKSDKTASNIVPVDQLTSVIKNEIGKRLDNVEYLLDKIISILKEFFPELLDTFDFTLVMDDGTVAAKLTPKIDKNLGEIYKKKGRGN